MKKVLVFGGAGFLGSHVADALSDAGYSVRLFDIRPSPYLRSDQEMKVGDILDRKAVDEAVKDCSIVYNFAGIADINEAMNKPIETAQVNILGNIYVLEACRNAKTERFIFASSVYVYSNHGSFYRASKQACERYVETYNERYGLNYTILRYGSLYGPRADGRNAIFRFLSEAMTNKSITFQGTGEELREYINVKDAARYSVEILKPGYENQPVLITGTYPVRIKDILTMVNEMMGGNIRLNFSSNNQEGHYLISPYSFHPKIGKKFIGNLYTDLGQGVLDCLMEIQERRLDKQYSGIGDYIYDKDADIIETASDSY